MSGLFDSKGNFISFEAARASVQLGTEFATSSRAWGFDPATWFGLMPDPDPILRKRGDDATILDELVGDDEVSTALEKRILRTQNKSNFTFNPGHAEGEEPTESSIAICKQLENDLARIPLRDLFGEILETPFFGPTFSELMWSPSNGYYRLEAIITKPRDWFGFNGNRQPVFRSVESAEGELLPQHKFLMTRHRSSYTNPYGVRLLTRCLWPVAFKRGGIEFWSRFCEKFGSAFLIAKAGKDAQERSIIANQLVSMIQDAVAVVPTGSEVEIAQASGKSGDLHKTYVSFWNRAISKVLTGQTLSTDQEGQGSRAASATHSEQLDSLAESDEAMLVSSMNELARIYARVNGGPDILPPVFGFSEPEDYSEKAELDKKLHEMGVRFKPVHFVNRYGLSEDEFSLDPDTVPATFSAPVSGTAAPDKNQDDYQLAIDDFADSLLEESAKLNGNFVTRIEKIVKQADSMEDLQTKLAELLGQDVGQNELEELISNAMINAALAGRMAVEDEASNGD
ncbi:DUF935 family protein [Desulfovibrio sp. UCD-KL4C]|uniref:DUF935 domain-containing protein n=1 Tax=Desulfovibrio sp. UCD-KL4C TaxID=2578120 RepID=UPI0025C1E734|nr:DUF935 family protein [Desulfovibrio sp. UCD-KL4C]